MHNKFIDIHVLQSVPPSCINRDENGSPKTAIYGGVSRLRVSSQAWKRAVREDFAVNLSPEESAQRTLHIVDLVADAITERDEALAERAAELAEEVVTATGVKIKPDKNGTAKVTGYLFFLSNAQVGLLADEAVAAAHEDRPIEKKTAKAALKGENSVDLALFGRMVADWPDANVDASCQVAHAISTHNAAHEFDFFTAVDDVKSQAEDADAGAGMMGTVEFSSATLYRYASINVQALVDNLGSESVAQKAISEFVRAFVTSMPTGKANTFANHTLPAFVAVTVGGQPVSLVGAFEKPIRASETSGYVESSIARLLAHAASLVHNYGLETDMALASTIHPDVSLDESPFETVTFPEMTARVSEILTEADAV